MAEAPEAIDGFNETLNSIYDAMVEPERWPQALDRIGCVLAADSAVIGVCGNGSPAAVTGAFAPNAIAGGPREWGHSAPCSDSLRIHDFIAPPDHAFGAPGKSSPAPAGISFVWRTACTEGASVRFDNLPVPMALSVMRARDRGAFDEAERRTLALLGRHVGRAIRMSLRVTASESRAQATGIALDAITAGVYVLDADGRLLFANARGTSQAATYFDPETPRLTPQSEGERRGFETSIAAAGSVVPGQFPRACVISGRDGRCLAVWAFPAKQLLPGLADARDVAHTTLLTMALQNDRALDPVVIRDVLGLSLGEARLAAQLWTGAELRDAAERLGITEGTARVVLKRVFRKLGINRQAQLVLRLSQLAQVGRQEQPRGTAPPGSVPGGIRH